MDTTKKRKPSRSSGGVHSAWSGAITFGLLSIPVRLFKANEPKDLQFNNLHRGCSKGQSRVKQSNFCGACDAPLLAEDKQRAYEYAKGQYVTIEDDELAALLVPSAHEIALTAFVDAGAVDAMLVQQAYWLEPEDFGAKPYALLRKALEAKSVVGIGKLTMGKRERVCSLRSHDDVIVLETLYYPEEMRALDSGNAPPVAVVSEPELEMALQLVDAFRDEFDPTAYHDAYRLAAYEMIERKKSGETVSTTPVDVLPAPSVDMMAALKATLEAQKAARAAAKAAA
jgi:DNA end-binding protein Ku